VDDYVARVERMIATVAAEDARAGREMRGGPRGADHPTYRAAYGIALAAEIEKACAEAARRYAAGEDTTVIDARVDELFARSEWNGEAV